MSLPLFYDEIKFDRHFKLEDKLISPDDSDIGYFVEIDILYHDNVKETTKNFPFCPENTISRLEKLAPNKNQNKAKTYTQSNKLICGWSDEEKYLMHYRILKIYIRHGMIVDNIYEKNKLKQYKWLEKYIKI